MTSKLYLSSTCIPGLTTEMVERTLGPKSGKKEPVTRDSIDKVGEFLFTAQ